MTSANGSPAPKSRVYGNKHRHSKSGSSISISLGPKYSPSQQNHYPNNHQLPQTLAHNLKNNLPHQPRAPLSTVTPPQTPKASASHTSSDVGGGKKKKRQRSKTKDASTKTVPIPIPKPDTSDSSKSYSPPLSAGFLSEQMTPPQNIETPSKAYAGPTFHSSPAPSALPMPKFMSKSVPATPAGNFQTALGLDGAKTSPSISREELSHLQKLFRADREEKELLKSKRSGADSTSSREASPDSSSKKAFWEPESPTTSFSSRSSFSSPKARVPGPEQDLFFPVEVDVTSPPPRNFTQRMAHLRSNTASARSTTQCGIEKDHRQEKAQKLIQFLQSPTTSKSLADASTKLREYKSIPKDSSPTPTRHNEIVHISARRDIYESFTSLSPNKYIPLLPGNKHQQFSPPPMSFGKDVKAMEADLRKILNMDTYASASPGSVMG